MAWVPVDLTLLMAVVTAVAVVGARLKHGPANSAIGFPMVFLALCFLGIAFASLEGYSVTKILSLYTFTALLMLAPFYLLRTQSQRSVFVGVLATIAIMVAALTLINPGDVSEYTDVTAFQGADTIGTARMTAMGVLILFVLAVTAKMSVSRRLMLIGAGVALLLVAIGTGSRGPIVAVVIAILGLIATSPDFRKVRGRAILAAAAVAGGAIYWATRDGGDGVERILGFFTGERVSSSGLRSYFWSEAVDTIRQHPLGIGWGEYVNLPGMSAYAVEGVIYPHNVILGVTAEAGWLVGAALVIFITASLVTARKHSTTPLNSAIYALLIFAVLNAMVSGDLNSNRLMWVLLSCAWLLREQLSSILPLRHIQESKIRTPYHSI